jgi:hypothetical protein
MRDNTGQLQFKPTVVGLPALSDWNIFVIVRKFGLIFNSYRTKNSRFYKTHIKLKHSLWEETGVS